MAEPRDVRVYGAEAVEFAAFLGVQVEYRHPAIPPNTPGETPVPETNEFLDAENHRAALRDILNAGNGARLSLNVVGAAAIVGDRVRNTAGKLAERGQHHQAIGALVAVVRALRPYTGGG